MSTYQKYVCFVFSLLASHEALSMRRATQQASRILGSGAVSMAGRSFATTQPNYMKVTKPLYMTTDQAAQILGVSKNATQQEIAERFSKIAKNIDIIYAPGSETAKKAMQELIEARDAFPSAFEAKERRIQKEFQEAIGDGNAGKVDALLRSGVKANSPLEGRYGPYKVKITTPLLSAIDLMQVKQAKDKYMDVIKTLLEHGADVNEASFTRNGDEKESPLMLAINYHDPELVKMLLDYGARPSDMDVKKDPLSNWVEKNKGGQEDDNIFDALISKGAKITDDHLQQAVQKRDSLSVDSLYKKGYQFTADHLKNASDENFSYLVAHGVQGVPDQNGKTKLDYYYEKYPEFDPYFNNRNYTQSQKESMQKGIDERKRDEEGFIRVFKTRAIQQQFDFPDYIESPNHEKIRTTIDVLEKQHQAAIDALKKQHDEKLWKDASIVGKAKIIANSGSWWSKK